MRLFFALLLLAAVAVADVVHLKGGKKVRGKVVAEDPEVVVNPYNSRVPGMTFGVQRFPKDRVKKILKDPPRKEWEFNRRLETVETVADCLALAAWCKEQKLKDQRFLVLRRGWKLAPGDPELKKQLGTKVPKGDPKAQRALARRFLGAKDDAERAAVLAEIRKDRAFPWSERSLLRALRSQTQKKGMQKDRPLSVLADKMGKPAYYTLFVPESYDPLTPTPLVFGLHGGGRGGADGKLVVGSGPQAMPFYVGQCERRGWICVCPTALIGGWGAKMNGELVDAVLAEVTALYNIDLNRVYLTGHSMGGGGTWQQGGRIPEVWAAAAPTASFAVSAGLDAFKRTGTPFYVYHSDDDPRTRIGGVRPFMKNLPEEKGLDFVYTELPRRGHTLPSEVIQDFFDFFSVRRRTVGRKGKATVMPAPSFARKVSREEKKYLPALELAEGAAPDDKLRALLKDLAMGGGVAEAAVKPLTAHKDPKVESRVAKVLLKSGVSPDVRMYAARVLGARKATSALKSLGRALLIETQADALLAMLEALDEIGDRSAAGPIAKFLKKRLAYMEGRRQGDWLHFSDWTTILPTLAQGCRVLRRLEAKETAPAVAAVLKGVFLTGMRVAFDKQLQNPAPDARAVAGAGCGALEAFGDAGVAPVLRRMLKEGEWSGDGSVRGHVEQALRALTK